MEKAGLGARFEAAQARRPLPPSPGAPQFAGTLLERVSDKVCGALGVECFVEVLFWIHRQTARRMLPLSEIESPLSGCFSQWPVPGRLPHCQERFAVGENFFEPSADGCKRARLCFLLPQAAAFREALNASATRCAGRASGSIPGIPPQPKSWHKYNMGYNQSKARPTFKKPFSPLGLCGALA